MACPPRGKLTSSAPEGPTAEVAGSLLQRSISVGAPRYTPLYLPQTDEPAFLAG